jgi:5-methyltetrahydropteroyltriglutamate--homocysteine methyltransferase
MKRSTDRILTTHTGSLPRPPALQEALARFDRGEGDPPDPGSVAEAVTGIVRRQAENGVDVVNDGEMGKVSYSTYVVSRMSGFGGTGKALELGDARDFPGWARMSGFDDTSTLLALPACIDEVRYVGEDRDRRDRGRGRVPQRRLPGRHLGVSRQPALPQPRGVPSRAR